MNIDALLAGLVAGELSAAEAAQMQRALAASPALRAEAQRYQRLAALLQRVAALPVEVPPSVLLQVEQRLAVRRPKEAAGSPSARSERRRSPRPPA